MNTNIKWAVALALFSSCKKLDHELTLREQESGIVRVIDISPDASTIGPGRARISDTVDLVAKIGLPGAEVKILLGNNELAIISRRSAQDTLINGYTTKIQAINPVEHFYLRIPADFPIGATHFSLQVKGDKKLAYSYTIVKPILLFSGKVGVSAALRTPQQNEKTDYGVINYYNPFLLNDGPMDQATSSKVIDAAVDKNTGTVYFLDQIPSDTSAGINSDRSGPVYLRKLESGTVTTLGGHGTDPNATNIKDRQFSHITAMKIGPDGMIYLAFIDNILPTPEGAQYYSSVLHAQIARLNPQTGILTTLIGSKAKPDVFGAIQGLVDGKADTAMVNAPRAMDFDKKGNLYFLDGTAESGSGLLRVLTTDGLVRTVMGQYTRTAYPYTTSAGVDTVVDFYEVLDAGNHIDGFYAEARLGNLGGLAVAGNGKIYLMESGGGIYPQSIRELNPDTRELSTIIGLPQGTTTAATTGNFKEIDLFGRFISSIDVDFDGNILYATNDYGQEGGRIYKMDLTAETVSLIAGGYKPNYQDSLIDPLPGTEVFLYIPRRIVFDQTGQLYVADSEGAAGVTIKKISLQRN